MAPAKEHPILFSGPMVQAILTGAKSQTRRIVQAPKCATVHGRRTVHERSFADRDGFAPGAYLHWAYTGGDHGDDVLQERVYPKWCKGDRLWVREAWDWGTAPNDPSHGMATFKAGGEPGFRMHPNAPADSNSWCRKWRGMPSIHMPRWASRLTLEITDVRVERLQSISTADAMAEGVEPRMTAAGELSYTTGFHLLWDSINGKRAGCSWADNPFVWAISFRRVTP
jgi:hypothetical protein